MESAPSNTGIGMLSYFPYFNVVNTVVLPPLAHFLDPNTLVLGVIGTSYPEESGHASCALIIPKGLQGHAFPDTMQL